MVPDNPSERVEVPLRAIYVCPAHPQAVRTADSPPPGERPYCPGSSASSPHKMVLIEVVEASELEVALRERDEAREDVKAREEYAREGWAWLDDALGALGAKTVFDIKQCGAEVAELKRRLEEKE